MATGYFDRLLELEGTLEPHYQHEVRHYEQVLQSAKNDLVEYDQSHTRRDTRARKILAGTIPLVERKLERARQDLQNYQQGA